jgi:AsmA protein
MAESGAMDRRSIAIRIVNWIIMKRMYAAVGIIAAGLLLGGLVFGGLISSSLSNLDIEAAVERHTGRTISFTGRPRLSLWPELAIELRNVELSNPPDTFEGRFAAADTVRLKVSGPSLWRRQPEVSEIVVEGARINLVVDSEARSNFAFEHQEGADGGFTLPPIVLVDARLAYLNERSAAALTVSNVDARIAVPDLGGPLELNGAFSWNDQRTNVALYARSPARLTTDGSPADFTISGPRLSAAFSGRALLKDGLELAGTLDFKADAMADFLSWAGLTTERAPERAPDLSTAGAPFSASGALDLSRRTIRITQAQLAFGRMHAQGNLAVSFARAKPHITANLGIDRLVLDAWAGPAGGNGESVPASGWSEAPVDLEFLEILDAEVSLAASEIVYGKLVAGPSRLDIDIVDGSLEAVLLEAQVYGGSASGRLMLAGSSPAALEASLKAKGVDSAMLLAALSGAELIHGKADVDLDLTARGASQQELVAMLKGEAHLRVAEGALSKLDIPATLGHVATAVADGWTAAGEGETPFAGLEASFVVTDGIAETVDLAMTGPVAEIAATGSVDLLSQRLDLKARPRLMARPQHPGSKEAPPPAPSRLPVPVVVEGPWSAPMIYPDVKGILDDPAAAYLTLAKLMVASPAGLDVAPGKTDKYPSETLGPQFRGSR